MSFAYTKKEFYVRESYETYYDTIRNLWQGTGPVDLEKNYITVTGTPGIGKSIFYIYFFQRWRKEFPQQTIVTAAFNNRLKLEECKVFKPGQLTGTRVAIIPFIEGALHLYDGPPEVKPSQNKMVCFTSPNKAWLDCINKSSDHTALYMPTWTLEELQTANFVLDLGLDDATIANRMSFLGGSARFCLTKETQLYLNEVSKITSKVNSIESFHDIKGFIITPHGTDDIHHSVLHIKPCLGAEGLMNCFFIDFCSLEVIKLLDQSLADKSDSKRLEFFRWLTASKLELTCFQNSAT